jgi:hypothetical protein
MATVNELRDAVEKVLRDLAAIPYSQGKIEQITVFDREGDHYLLVNRGWDRHRRVHGCVIHIDVIDGKAWIQYDATDFGIATDLMAAGIPKDQIVLAFKPPEVRPHTGFAVA